MARGHSNQHWNARHADAARTGIGLRRCRAAAPFRTRIDDIDALMRGKR